MYPYFVGGVFGHYKEDGCGEGESERDAEIGGEETSSGVYHPGNLEVISGQ